MTPFSNFFFGKLLTHFHWRDFYNNCVIFKFLILQQVKTTMKQNASRFDGKILFRFLTSRSRLPHDFTKKNSLFSEFSLFWVHFAMLSFLRFLSHLETFFNKVESKAQHCRIRSSPGARPRPAFSVFVICQVQEKVVKI